MPEVLPGLDAFGVSIGPPEPRAALFWDGSAWHVPRVDDEGRVQVRGEDQLFSLKVVLAQWRGGAISGASGFIDSLPVPAGEYWVVTTIVAFDNTSPTTAMEFQNLHNGAGVIVHNEVKAFAIAERSCWQGVTILDVDDVIRVGFAGGLVADDVYVHITGYRMTVET